MKCLLKKCWFYRKFNIFKNFFYSPNYNVCSYLMRIVFHYLSFSFQCNSLFQFFFHYFVLYFSRILVFSFIYFLICFICFYIKKRVTGDLSNNTIPLCFELANKPLYIFRYINIGCTYMKASLIILICCVAIRN